MAIFRDVCCYTSLSWFHIFVCFVCVCVCVFFFRIESPLQVWRASYAYNAITLTHAVMLTTALQSWVWSQVAAGFSATVVHSKRKMVQLQQGPWPLQKPLVTGISHARKRSRRNCSLGVFKGTIKRYQNLFSTAWLEFVSLLFIKEEAILASSYSGKSGDGHFRWSF